MLDKTIGKGKFEPKSRKCIFIRYSIQSKAYRLWDPEARKILRSRDVTFTGLYQPENNPVDFIDEEIFEKGADGPGLYLEIPGKQKSTEKHKEHEEKGEREESDEIDMEEMEDDTPVTTKRAPGRPKKVLTGKRGRPRKLFNTVTPKGIEGTSKSEKPSSQEDKEEYHVAGLIEHADPQTPAQAFASPEVNEWKKAMRDEYEVLKRNKTWIIVNRPKQKKVVE